MKEVTTAMATCASEGWVGGELNVRGWAANRARRRTLYAIWMEVKASVTVEIPLPEVPEVLPLPDPQLLELEHVPLQQL